MSEIFRRPPETEMDGKSRDSLFAAFRPGIEHVELNTNPEKQVEPARTPDQPHPGDGVIPDKQTLSNAGEEAYAYRDGYTQAGRLYEAELYDRQNTALAPEHFNRQGQTELNSIINAPDARWTTGYNEHWGSYIEACRPDGTGAVWSADGKHLYSFLTP